MKARISLWLAPMLMSLALSAQAADKPLPLPKPPEDPGFSGDMHNARFSVGPALGVWNRAFGFGGDVSLAFRLGHEMPIYVGVMSGLHTFSTFIRMSSIPVLGTVLYRFRISDSTFTPYIGGAAGIGILFGSGLTTAARFEAFGRVGLEFELDRQTAVYVEPRIGVMDGQFLFLGGLGITFSF